VFIAIAVDNLAQAQAMTAAELEADHQIKTKVIRRLLLCRLPVEGEVLIIFIHQQLVATQQIKHNNNISK